MIRLVDALQAKTIDSRTQSECAVSGLQIMQTAGEQACKRLQVLLPHKDKKIVIVAGPGNNGGDGVVIYKELLRTGFNHVSLFFIEEPKSDSLKKQLSSLSSGNFSTLKTSAELPNANVYIDALFGVGLSKNISGTYKKIIELINSSEKSLRISIDMPSGLSTDTGNIMGVSILAHHTLTFGVRKLGQVIQEGPRVCGHLHVLDIGFPRSVVEQVANTYFLFTKNDFKNNIPKRKATGNKSNHGRLQVLAGSTGMWGAAILSAKAAYKVGAGYVHIQTEQPYFRDLPEALVEKKITYGRQFTYAVGPGWGVSEKRKKILETLSQEKIDKVILDADGLNTVAKFKLFPLLRTKWVLTPHTQELSRLLGDIGAAKIEENRPKWALLAAKKLNSIVLLKGFRTLVVKKNKVFIIPTGNSALSKAGSGDVLTGIISGLRAQKMSALSAALCGAYLHGAIADEWIKTKDVRGLTPSDIISELPVVMKSILKG
jgi:ADP-dependent NAD(P)H-hydrate dehydratase / NAD(P)H-hydrate epimerase